MQLGIDCSKGCTYNVTVGEAGQYGKPDSRGNRTVRSRDRLLTIHDQLYRAHDEIYVGCSASPTVTSMRAGVFPVAFSNYLVLTPAWRELKWLDKWAVAAA